MIVKKKFAWFPVKISHMRYMWLGKYETYVNAYLPILCDCETAVCPCNPRTRTNNALGPCIIIDTGWKTFRFWGGPGANY